MKILMYGKDKFVNPSYDELVEWVGENDEQPWEEVADVFVLFRGRHPMPEKIRDAEAIFADVNPMAFGKLEEQAEAVLKTATSGHVYVYVTGLTPATVAVINVCHEMKLKLVLMHYDCVGQTYMPQWVY